MIKENNLLAEKQDEVKMQNVIVNSTNYSFDVQALTLRSCINPCEVLSLDDYIEQQNTLTSTHTVDELLALIS